MFAKATSKGRHAENAVTDVFRAKRHSESGSRRNGHRLWREGLWLVEALVGGGGARARPPVFPRTMPNGAFVKVSSFTADAGAAAAARRAPQPGSDNRSRRSDRRSTEVVRLFHRPLPPPPLSPPRVQDNTHWHPFYRWICHFILIFLLTKWLPLSSRAYVLLKLFFKYLFNRET